MLSGLKLSLNLKILKSRKITASHAEKNPLINVREQYSLSASYAFPSVLKSVMQTTRKI